MAEVDVKNNLIVELESSVEDIKADLLTKMELLTDAEKMITQLQADLANLQPKQTGANDKQEEPAIGASKYACVRLLRTTFSTKMSSPLTRALTSWRVSRQQAVAAAAQHRSASLLADLRAFEDEKQALQSELKELKERKDSNSNSKNKNKDTEKSSANQLLTGLSVLDVTTKLRMSPMDYRKAGAVVQNMQQRGYTDADCNAICRALFLDQSKEDMKAAWRIFAKEQPLMKIHDLKEALAMMFENVSENEVDDLLKNVDSAAAGVEFAEFSLLVKAISKKSADGSPNTESDAKAKEDDQSSGIFPFKFGF